MTVYQLLKLNNLIKNHRIKFLGLWGLNLFNKRTLSVNFDPVFACNLRCKMCYFTDKEYMKNIKGIMPDEDLALYARSFFNNALKLQIGCGAEPTLYKNLTEIVALGRQHNVPYITLTTNANLLTAEKIHQLSQAGLHEFTVSLHGVHKESYEYFMGKGNYELFIQNLKYISEEKKNNPNLKLRINYTFNKDNFDELEDFFECFQSIDIDVLQIRPIQKIGETEYNDFDLSSLKEKYKNILEKIKNKSKEKGVILLSSEELSLEESSNNQSFIVPYTYCYVSPKFCWRKDFDFKKETYSQWSKRTHWKSEIFFNIFKSKKEMNEKLKTKKLIYSVEIN